ncbi:hypothetical protein RhiirA4_478198 [Rhizophagus irregularis]|uniref:Gag-pol fusion protein n=1 Tax=Rhizophagus irregularis TaxID=588596 RepID=A0A2I1HED9_9GLOM|nr:hypothetical protein RhiirA4_478198 [Rhizophagus irregularis]
MSSAKLREIPLEETIRKVLHSELKLIFPPHFFQDSGLIASKQIVASTEAKIVSQNDVSLSSKDSDESSLEEESLDDPMEINFVKKKEPKTSVATVKCKIRRLKIPAMTLDSGAEPPIITENIVERVGDKIDKSEIHDLEGISTVPVESVGVVRNLPITLAPGLTIHEDFVVVRYKKPTLIFSNQLLKKYRCAVDWATNELKIPLNGKDYIIPVTMHKIKNKLEVNCVRTTPECDDLPAPDKISQDLDADNIVERVGDKIDKSEIHDLEGISTVPVESVGVVRNLPITLAPGLTIHEDFVVVRYKKPTLIFSNQLLKKYRCAVDWATNELKIPLNGKDYIIPVTMHKIKNKLEVNCVRTTPECDDLPAPDKISQDLDADVTLKKK